MAPVIGLLGATGYTGELTTQELLRRGIPHVLGGRDAEKLKALPGDGERRIVDIDDPASLAVFCHGLDAVISCIGPFVRYGDRVLDACVRAGVPYVDSTGEKSFMSAVYAKHANAAVPIVPACGFDVVPGDMAADIACSALEDEGKTVESVLLSYTMHGASPSRGTARTAAEIFLSESFVPARVKHRGPHGPRSMVSVPFAEGATISLARPHVSATVAFAVPSLVSTAMPALGLGVRLGHPLLKLAAPLIQRRIDGLPDGPSDEKRQANAFSIVAEARTAEGEIRQSVVTGQDPYGLTAICLVEAALRVAAPDSPTGPLSPSMAFASKDFLEVAGLSWLLA